MIPDCREGRDRRDRVIKRVFFAAGTYSDTRSSTLLSITAGADLLSFYRNNASLSIT